jgi:hypothetical protein
MAKGMPQGHAAVEATLTVAPEGTVADLVADDEGDDLTDGERRALHEAFLTSWKSAEAGGLQPASRILDELRPQR